MQAYKSWRKRFTSKNMAVVFQNNIEGTFSVGNDRVTSSNFKDHLTENIEIICNKLNHGTYHFTAYKMMLISKGIGKAPREIAIPTIRDKLVTRTLNDVLIDIYGDSIKVPLLQLVIQDIIKHKRKYNAFLKIDIKSFFGSIDHEILLQKLKKKIKKPELLSIITNAIQTPYLYNCHEKIKRKKGVPEGVSISNSLANIYMLELDEKYKSNKDIYYCRYVDDILILLSDTMSQDVKNDLEHDIAALSLEVNNKKCKGEKLSENCAFDYLGYCFKGNKITVRKSSIFRFEQSVEDLVRKNIHKTDKELEWKLNLKITGFIWDKKKYGWMFFYSQITDLSLLYQLDHTIALINRRYGIDKRNVQCKKMIRTYHEITKNLHGSRYIVNIDTYTIDDKRNLLHCLGGKNVENLSEKNVEWEFRKKMRREANSMERDIEGFS